MLKKLLVCLGLLGAGVLLLFLFARQAHFERQQQISVAQSLPQVWQVLSDIDGWSRWWPGVERAKLLGPLAVGSQLELKLKGVPEGEAAELFVMQPQNQLGWQRPGVLDSEVSMRLSLAPTVDGTLVQLTLGIDGPQAKLATVSGADKFDKYLTAILKLLEQRLVQGPAAAAGEKD